VTTHLRREKEVQGLSSIFEELVDLIIRTGGENRLSNFLLWQSAHAYFYSTPVYWPDFDEEELRKALVAYGRWKRGIGGPASTNG